MATEALYVEKDKSKRRRDAANSKEVLERCALAKFADGKPFASTELHDQATCEQIESVDSPSTTA